ncbi:putative alpha-amylase AmyA [Dioszegia hungarica]|uniref:alpha-amylase n=1 Tax=Dioszegia hungarica TaxID=4972 RepID=A0AA38H5J7_9TREE|nr:putative alpha-amylase AmyA [Dioszegia hungarica]KAI9634323.1 putative alpha-amylase AmyA [Dioszegia hungarica]
MLPFTALFGVLSLLASAQAASKDDWRSRSVYQLLTDRFAPPMPGLKCNLGSYCGGNWRTIIDNLDYIEGLGFDSIWISPTGLGIEGPTKWGDNYHGYWGIDQFGINQHFGTAADLKALSAALHDRGMLLMVDLAVNHIASTNTDISDSALASKSDGKLLFKKESEYHPVCKINYDDKKSVEQCWMAQDGVALMDLKTESAAVADVLKSGFAAYLEEYGIDGARIDAAKHMDKQFLHDFCEAGNTFCIGEVLEQNTGGPAAYTQGDNGIDSVFGFGMTKGAVEVFAKDKPMSTLARFAKEALTAYADPTVIGAVLDNHDLPRFNSLASDKSNVYNAMALQFLFGGIPTMYYGLEQNMTGEEDPQNRQALWLNGELKTDGESYQRIKRLNLVRKKMGELGGFHEVLASQVAVQDDDIAFERNGGLLVLTKRGEGQGGEWTVSEAGFSASAKVVDLLSCTTATAGADGSLKITFKNGFPSFYVTSEIAGQTGICGGSKEADTAPASSSASASSTFSASSDASTSIAGSATSSSAQLNAPDLIASEVGSTGSSATAVPATTTFTSSASASSALTD